MYPKENCFVLMTIEMGSGGGEGGAEKEREVGAEGGGGGILKQEGIYTQSEVVSVSPDGATIDALSYISCNCTLVFRSCVT